MTTGAFGNYNTFAAAWDTECEGAGMDDQLPEMAYYYPEWMWFDSDKIKNLILFFDGIVLLVPEYMRHRPYDLDAPIVSGLQEQGLLRILEPETVVDSEATTSLAASMADIVERGGLDNLSNKNIRFGELSRSRLGYHSNAVLADEIFQELHKRGLASPSEDGVSIPMHPVVRSLILVLLAQIMRSATGVHGLSLNPVTDRPDILAALSEVLGLSTLPSAGHVVSLDLQAVSVDVSDVPLDEVLGFRSDHRAEYREYALNLKRFMREIAQSPLEQQQSVLVDRRNQIKDSGNHLRRQARRAWKSRLSLGLGLVGASWTAIEGHDPITGVLAAAAGIAGALGSAEPRTEAFSYLFAAKRRFRN